MLRSVAVVVVVAAAVAGVAAVATPVPNTDMTFESFVAKYHKAYGSPEEAAMRARVFAANVAAAKADNAAAVAAGDDPVFGVTKFSDLRPFEFHAAYTGYKPSQWHALQKKYAAEVDVPRRGSRPADVDWRQKGLVTAVKNQGQCGSCWAFSATEQVETDWIRRGHSKVELAPQQVVSCDHVDDGCGGGDTVTAYSYIMNAGGLMKESAYPYTSGRTERNGECKFHRADVAANITAWSYVSKSKKTEDKMVDYVASTGPVSVCVATNGWQSYNGGILTARKCGKEVDHCVQVAGYGNLNGDQPYWLVRNSWAADWGEAGYIRLSLGDNTCDVAGEATVTKAA